MRSSKSTLRKVDTSAAAELVSGTCIARLAGRGDGQVLVDWGQGPTPARHVARLRRDVLAAAKNSGREALVAFDRGDPGRPVVLDLLAPLDGDAPLMELESVQGTVEHDARVDGQCVVIEAKQEVLLRCGEAYIHLRADGHVVVKGNHVVSRATGLNKIKGGAVRIN